MVMNIFIEETYVALLSKHLIRVRIKINWLTLIYVNPNFVNFVKSLFLLFLL